MASHYTMSLRRRGGGGGGGGGGQMQGIASSKSCSVRPALF